MTYKFLNTIIDDLFAFVIKMPLLHRLSVFRDDLVFLVYIYQRWIYRVDPKRANEFGCAAALSVRSVTRAVSSVLLICTASSGPSRPSVCQRWVDQVGPDRTVVQVRPHLRSCCEVCILLANSLPLFCNAGSPPAS